MWFHNDGANARMCRTLDCLLATRESHWWLPVAIKLSSLAMAGFEPGGMSTFVSSLIFPFLIELGCQVIKELLSLPSSA